MKYIRKIAPQSDHIKRDPSTIIPTVRQCLAKANTAQELFLELRRGSNQKRIIDRINIVLAAQECNSFAEIAAKCSVTASPVKLWLERFIESGPKGLQDKARSGRPTRFQKERQELYDLAITMQPGTMEQIDGTFAPFNNQDWSAKSIAHILKVSESSANRYQKKVLRENGSSSNSYCYSSDPDLVLKSLLTDLLYRFGSKLGVNVLCFDEKPCIQAIRRDYVFSQTGQIKPQDRYMRAGTTHLLAIQDVSSGEVHISTGQKKDATALSQFFRNYFSQPGRTERHSYVIMDNLPVHGRIQQDIEKEFPVTFVYTGTNSSWQNLVESWFSQVERHLGSKSFDSVEELEKSLYKFTTQYNDQLEKRKTPAITWKADVPQIMMERLYLTLSCAHGVPKEASILIDGEDIGLNKQIQSALGCMARELQNSRNIIHGVLDNPEFFSESTIAQCKQALKTGDSKNGTVPACLHALVSKRKKALEQAVLKRKLRFSPMVYEAYQDLDKAQALINRLVSLFRTPYSAQPSKRPALWAAKNIENKMKVAESEMEALQRRLDETLKGQVKRENENYLRDAITKQKKKINKYRQKLEHAQQSWEKRRREALPVLNRIKYEILTKIEKLCKVVNFQAVKEKYTACLRKIKAKMKKQKKLDNRYSQPSRLES